MILEKIIDKNRLFLIKEVRNPIVFHILIRLSVACLMVYRSREVVLNGLNFLGWVLQPLIGIE